MAEWEFIVDSDDLPDPQPEEPPRSRKVQRWHFAVIAVLAFLTIGAVTLYRQRVDQQAAMRADLEAAIFEEETVRFFGQLDQAGRYSLPTASSDWQQRYRQTFEPNPNQSPPTQIELQSMDFDGRCATVTAALDGYAQVRTYCLHNQQWRRAPVRTPNWGDEQSSLVLPNRVQLVFRTRDRAFAAALADDLPAVFNQLDHWRSQQDETSAAPGSLTIVIEPRDLHPPLIAEEPGRLVLNSPWLVPFAGDGTPSGQAAVRLALAEALLRQGGLVVNEINSPLPGAARVQTAVQRVLAANLLLAPETLERLAGNWQARLNGEWLSPFYVDLLPGASETEVVQATLAANVMADYISRSAGLDALLSLQQQLPAASSGDNLFQNILNRPLAVVENETATYARTGDLNSVSDLAAASELPLRAALLEVEPRASGAGRMAVQPVDTAESILVEIPPELEFRTANGYHLPAACLPAGTTLEVDGGWLEIQRRLRAGRITVQQVTPLPLEPVPAGTVAYLIEGELPTDPKFIADKVFPSSRPYSVASELLIPRRLLALRQDGTTQPLISLSRTLRVVPLPISEGETVHFLFIVDLPECNRSWFVHYEHQKGVSGQWLGPPRPVAWVWQSDQKRLLLLDSMPGGAGHNIYGADEMFSLQPVGQTSTLVSVTGWNEPVDQIVFVKRAWMGAIGIGLLDPDSGAIRRARVYIQPLRARRLSPDGAWLTYLTGVRNRFDPPYRLDALHLETLQETTLVQVEDHQAVGSAIWSPYLARSQLAVLAGSLDEDGMLRPARILLARPDQPGTYEVVVEATAGEQIAMPVFCEDGSLLYRAEQDSQYRLMQQRPGATPLVLLTRDRPFQPLACS